MLPLFFPGSAQIMSKLKCVLMGCHRVNALVRDEMNSSSSNISRKPIFAVLVKLKTSKFIDYLFESRLETEYSSFRSYTG